jgi:hypothetical protein
VLWRSGTELGTLDELDLQIKPMFIVNDAAHPATLLQQVCYAGMGSVVISIKAPIDSPNITERPYCPGLPFNVSKVGQMGENRIYRYIFILSTM